jgi:hypothetical protein
MSSRHALTSSRARLVGTALAAITLALVFALYTRGDFLVSLANQVWACF